MDEIISLEELFLEIKKELGNLDEEILESIGLTLQPLVGTDVC